MDCFARHASHPGRAQACCAARTPRSPRRRWRHASTPHLAPAAPANRTPLRAGKHPIHGIEPRDTRRCRSAPAAARSRTCDPDAGREHALPLGARTHEVRCFARAKIRPCSLRSRCAAHGMRADASRRQVVTIAPPLQHADACDRAHKWPTPPAHAAELP
jgi:hypothetical protein